MTTEESLFGLADYNLTFKTVCNIILFIDFSCISKKFIYINKDYIPYNKMSFS